MCVFVLMLGVRSFLQVDWSRRRTGQYKCPRWICQLCVIVKSRESGGSDPISIYTCRCIPYSRCRTACPVSNCLLFCLPCLVHVFDQTHSLSSVALSTQQSSVLLHEARQSKIVRRGDHCRPPTSKETKDSVDSFRAYMQRAGISSTSSRL